jgi:hypothetical protein
MVPAAGRATSRGTSPAEVEKEIALDLLIHPYLATMA